MGDALEGMVIVDEMKSIGQRSFSGAVNHGRATHRDRIQGATTRLGGDQVLDQGEDLCTTVRLTMMLSQSPHCLRATQLMEHQAINLEEGQILSNGRDDVVIPDLIEICF